MRYIDDAFPILPRGLRKGLIADIACTFMAEMHQQLISVIPGGHFLSRDGAFAFVTGMPAPRLNGVSFEQPNPEISGVVSLLDTLSAARIPFSLQLRLGTGEEFAWLAAARRMERKDDLVLMAANSTPETTAIPQFPELTIRQLLPEQASCHGGVVAAAQELEQDAVRPAMSPGLLRLPGVRCYLGEVDGQPVSSALSVTHGLVASIVSVATVPAARDRGFASAIIVRALADSLAAGAECCWLEVTAARSAMFRRLGFHPIESRQYWVSTR